VVVGDKLKLTVLNGNNPPFAAGRGGAGEFVQFAVLELSIKHPLNIQGMFTPFLICPTGCITSGGRAFDNA